MSEAVKPEVRFTYEDYLSWPGEERWELINGHAWAMSPAPSFRHQTLVNHIYGQVYLQLKGKKCRARTAPLDVRLTEKKGKKTETHVVQPDVLVFCKQEIADEKGLTAAPDWILEVLSDSTSWKDTTVKLELYRRFGVREYWILNPETGLLLVYLLKEDGTYDVPKPYLGGAVVPITILPGVTVDLGEAAED